MAQKEGSGGERPPRRPAVRPPPEPVRRPPLPASPVEGRPRPDRGLPSPFDHQREPPPAPEAQSGVRILRAQTVANPTQGPAVVTTPIVSEPEITPEADDPAVRNDVLGVNIAEGVAYLAVVDPNGHPRLDLVRQLVPAATDNESALLADFARQITETLQDLTVGSVAIARPLRYTNWTYTSAFERISLETCFMLVAHQLDLRFESVGQHHAANVVGLPLKGLGDSLRTKLRLERSGDWQNRWPALLVALGVALELHGISLSDAGRGR
jgi:hypothetical protein